MGGMATKTTVYLPDDLKRELKRAAAETGRSEAEVIREGIRLAVRSSVPPKPRAGSFAHGNLAGRVDDVLAAGFGRD